MTLKPGDRVSFLNEKRDGVVKKILNNKLLLVAIEDGFEIPVMESDLVILMTNEERIQTKKPQTEYQAKEDTIDTDADADFPQRRDLYVTASDSGKIKAGLYIAFIPRDTKHIPSSGFGVYLVNHLQYDCLFTYSLKDAAQHIFVCKDFDRVDEESAILLDVIDITDLETWKDMAFQFLFYKPGSSATKAPLTVEVHIAPVKFYKEEHYLFSQLLHIKCILVSAQSGKEQVVPEVWEEEKWENKIVEKPVGIKVVGHIKDYLRMDSFPQKHIIEPGIAEVDLHIEELTENYTGMSNFELLNIQLNYFIKMMENAIAHKFRKIYFIHGVGNGKLKQEIIALLKKDYPSYIFADAPIKKYGMGATEVLLDNLQM
jgi:hypothetical protein